MPKPSKKLVCNILWLLFYVAIPPLFLWLTYPTMYMCRVDRYDSMNLPILIGLILADIVATLCSILGIRQTFKRWND